MDTDHVGIVTAVVGLGAIFGALALPSPGLLILAYLVIGVSTWLLVRGRVSPTVVMVGGFMLGAAAIVALVNEYLAIGFRGHPIASLSVQLESLLWGTLLVLGPLVALGGGLVVRTRAWGRTSAFASLVLAGVALLLATRVLPVVTVSQQAPGFGVLPVLVALAGALSWLVLDIRAGNDAPSTRPG